jgi:hypothetical protein
MHHVQSVLDHTRQPQLAENVDHTYDDKYALIEFLTNTSIAAQMNALERLGLHQEHIIQVMGWVHGTSSSTSTSNNGPSSKPNRSVTLRFVAEDTCQFMMEQEVDMNVGITHDIEKTTTTSTGPTGSTSGNNTKTETIKTNVITKVKEYHWR